MQAPASSSAPHKLVIASRESRLALWQAEHVRAALQQYYPACDVSILGMTTRGDQILDRTLSKVGGKGLFVKELEIAMAEGRADLAVHSLKDVPMELPEGFTLTAVMTREDARDAFVSSQYASLDEMPPGAVVGTSSLRREAALRARYPHLVIKPLRGNLDTRLGKLDRGDYGAIILAAAGLKRLGLGDRIRALIGPESSLPAAGQGALGIEIRSDRPELAAWLAPLNDATTAMAVLAERAVSRRLGGSCQVPLGAHARWHGEDLQLDAFVAMPDGSRNVRAHAMARVTSAAQAEQLGSAVAGDLLGQGAGEILAVLEAAHPADKLVEPAGSMATGAAGPTAGTTAGTTADTTADTAGRDAQAASSDGTGTGPAPA
ncbi:hydroxymethylbilane synthase [Cupriavidus plantarum]|uniref:Porphobilinogen deaminase n=1 Tax=Cupriavidus plantarum TaxID=942865 RepID=A0A316FL02_9BURK|nr:hydroxymethylbilane synthase [Cupriavidus plantarum]PWK38330.1 hydroxymethylbilane synthase [Cupriavidus plantarum]